MSDPQSLQPAAPRERASRIIAAGIILALLYVGRPILIPLALAILLSLLLWPAVRAMRRIGLGRVPAVLLSVLVFALSGAAVAAILATQVLRVGASIPRYEGVIEHKLGTLDRAMFGRLGALAIAGERLLEGQVILSSSDAPAGPRRTPGDAPPRVIVLESPQDDSTPPLKIIGNALSKLWPAVQSAGIVLIVLIFALFEHDSLRDRVIRLAGAGDIRKTTLALNDAGERLSRFFASQFLVNVSFGIAISVCLAALHVPQPILWGSLAAVLRFVPYVGVAIAAFCATTFALAVDPGWLLAVGTLAAFIALDIFTGQFLEPHLYGHATGLSPLAIVIAAIFWGALWGAAGLILSTPLTLCLVVAGRHVRGFGFLEVLLSDAQALTLPQRFYQRALCADSHGILLEARRFLERDSLIGYCDRVLIPALHLAHLDNEANATSDTQYRNMRRITVEVVAALSGKALSLPLRRPRGSALAHVNAGRWLRQQREELSGRWQGPLEVPPGSIVICSGLGTSADDLTAELMVRTLRIQGIDARHFSPEEGAAGLPAAANPDSFSIVCLVSAFPGPERERAATIARRIHELLPRAHVVKVFCSGAAAPVEMPAVQEDSETLAGSLGHAIQICQSCQESRHFQAAPVGAVPGGNAQLADR
jgi:predicted PurR-regulated permease PerM